MCWRITTKREKKVNHTHERDESNEIEEHFNTLFDLVIHLLLLDF